MTHPTYRSATQAARGLAGRLARTLALLPLAALPALPAAAQTQQNPPVIHFVASGDYSHSTGRVTVDVGLEEGARLNVTLASPSGSSENLSLDRDGRRYSWTGPLREAGTWRAEATVSGAGAPMTANATVSLDPGTPTCSLSVSGPDMATDYLEAEIVVNSCDARAATGDIATRYITVTQDGVQISTLDASDQCERTFVLQGGGSYEANLTVADDRGVSATCSSSGLGVEAIHSRYWPTADFVAGTYRSERVDIVTAGETSLLGGAGIGLTLPHNAGAERTNAFTVRAGGGFAHNYWIGSSFDLILTRQTPGGFFGLGGGLWGVGDSDIMDGGVFATAGFNLPNYTGAGPMQAFTELRLFARHIAAPADNFSALVGFRLNFKRTHQLRAR